MISLLIESLHFILRGWVGPAELMGVKDAKRAQAEACALKMSVIKLDHESPRSETSAISFVVTDHIQHEIHSFLFVFSVS